MTNTSQETAAQYAHERRLATDIEYAIQCKKDEVYSDLVNFHQFLEDYQLDNEIVGDLRRALVNVSYSSVNKQLAVMDALENIKDTINLKIAEVVRSGK